MWGPLIQGGAAILSSILPGLFGSSASSQMNKQFRYQQALINDQREYDRGHFSRLVEDSQRAGINPLTALRGGGGAGYSQTHAPVLSMSAYEGANIGDALAAGLQTGVQAAFDYDPVAEEKSRLELDIMRGQLARINRDTEAFTRLGGAPAATGSRYRTAGVTPSGPLKAGERTNTNPYPVGTEGFLKTSPYHVDAEAWETRYGDIAQEIGGLSNVIADLGYSAYRAVSDRFGGSAGARPSRSAPAGRLTDGFGLFGSLNRKAAPKYRTGEKW